MIELGRDTPKEAVCQVFEKVNTGGVTLTVFELLTATFAADDFQLRPDWEERERTIRSQSILAGVSNTDFVEAVTLLATLERRKATLRDGTDADRASGVGSRVQACRHAAAGARRLPEVGGPADGGLQAGGAIPPHAAPLRREVLPYGSQLIPLAAILTILGHDWEPHAAREKLAPWYWCGVLGELYGVQPRRGSPAISPTS